MLHVWDSFPFRSMETRGRCRWTAGKRGHVSPSFVNSTMWNTGAQNSSRMLENRLEYVHKFETKMDSSPSKLSVEFQLSRVLQKVLVCSQCWRCGKRISVWGDSEWMKFSLSECRGEAWADEKARYVVKLGWRSSATGRTGGDDSRLHDACSLSIASLPNS